MPFRTYWTVTMTVLGLFLAVAWAEHGNKIVAGAAVIVALGVIYRYLVRPVAAAWQDLATTVATVKQEFAPNHGSSMRDSIDRVERVVGQTSTRVDELHHRLDGVEARMTAAEDVITQPHKKGAA